MTKVIAALMIGALLYGSWEFFLYWEKVKNQEETQKQEAAAAKVRGDQLPGVPYELEQSLHAAEERGPGALNEWLKAYGHMIEDPRKAWIQLDYCVMVSRDNPEEARKLFAQVKSRLKPSSPVWSRVQQLENTYQ